MTASAPLHQAAATRPTVSAAETPATHEVAGAKTRRHLDELDVVRGVTMVGVVGVHTLSFSTNGSNIAAGALTIMLHFTRESFFTLMGFVLVFSRMQRPTTWPAFWRKRFPLVAVPYVVWSAIYVLWPGGAGKHPGTAFHAVAIAIIDGKAWYHLYFLLVTLQIYLLFPLIVWLVRVTRRHHLLLLGVSLAVQLAGMGLAQYGPAPQGSVADWWWNYRDELIFSYQFYVLLGAVAAAHADAVLAWVDRHVGAVLAGALVAAGVTQAWYFVDLAAGESPGHAYSVFQPAEVVWSVAAVAALLALGCVWARRRRAGGEGRAISILSRHSFGMFLVHPLVLYWLIRWGYVGTLRAHVPDLLAYAGVYPVVVVIALLIAIIFSRTPISLPVTGRPRVRKPARRGAP